MYITDKQMDLLKFLRGTLPFSLSIVVVFYVLVQGVYGDYETSRGWLYINLVDVDVLFALFMAQMAVMYTIKVQLWFARRHDYKVAIKVMSKSINNVVDFKYYAIIWALVAFTTYFTHHPGYIELVGPAVSWLQMGGFLIILANAVMGTIWFRSTYRV